MGGRWTGFLKAVVVVALLVLALPASSVGRGATGPDPAVERWPVWPWPTACGGHTFDPVQVFGGPTGAERGSRPSERALRAFLVEQLGFATRIAPMRNYRRVSERGSQAEFASGRLRSRFGVTGLNFEKRRGRWRWWGSGPCTPTSVVAGESAITWLISGEQESLGPETTRLSINLGPGPCNSGQSQNDRAREPVFHRMGGRLLMVMRLEPLPPGGYTCEGSTEPPMEVELPEPLGELHLFDGATYPPVFAEYRWRLARDEPAALEWRDKVRERRAAARRKRSRERQRRGG